MKHSHLVESCVALTLLCLMVVLWSPEISSAQQLFNGNVKFIPLAGIPGLTSTTYTLPELINTLYRIAIVVGALAAVIKITIAGVKYMGTDVIGTKGEAREDIKSALLGLLILLSTTLILKTIIGDINLNILQLNAPGQASSIGTGGSAGGATSNSSTAGTGNGGQLSCSNPTRQCGVGQTLMEGPNNTCVCTSVTTTQQ